MSFKRRSSRLSSAQIKMLSNKASKSAKKTVKQQKKSVDKTDPKPVVLSDEITFSFSLPILSIPKGRGRHAVRSSKNKATGEINESVVTYTPERTRKHESSVRMLALKALKDIEVFDGAFTADTRIAVIFFFNPEEFPRKKPDRVTDKVVGDVDNHQKSLLDGLNGILFEDDSLVVSIHADKVLRKNEPSSIEISVRGFYLKGS